MLNNNSVYSSLTSSIPGCCCYHCISLCLCSWCCQNKIMKWLCCCYCCCKSGWFALISLSLIWAIWQNCNCCCCCYCPWLFFSFIDVIVLVVFAAVPLDANRSLTSYENLWHKALFSLLLYLSSTCNTRKKKINLDNSIQGENGFKATGISKQPFIRSRCCTLCCKVFTGINPGSLLFSVFKSNAFL